MTESDPLARSLRPSRTATFATRAASILLLTFAVVLWGCAPEEESGADTDDGAASGSAARAGEDVAFVGVDVIPMDGERVLEDRTVVVRGDRIEEIGPADQVEVPDGAREIEASGRYLIPGLAEMHAHVPAGDDPGSEAEDEEAEGDDEGAEGSDPGTEEAERVLFLYLSNGITTVRGMLGQPVHLDLRERAARDEILSPRIYTSGPSLNGNSIPSPDSGRRAVRHQAEAGYDFLKIHPGLTRESYDAIADAADSAGIRWAGHVPAEVGLEGALEAGQATIDHLDRYVEAILPEGAGAEDREPLFFGMHLADRVDRSRIPELAEATAEAGVWNVPTQSLIEHLVLPDDPGEMAERPEMRYMPSEVVESWVERKRDFLEQPGWSEDLARTFVEVRHEIIRELHEAGAGLLLGSDAPQVWQVPGFSIQAELRMLVAAGLSPYEALETGTRNVADYFDDLEEYGTVEEGKVADLVLLEENPLEDIASLERRAGVMVRGRWLAEDEIRERLEEIAAAGGG